MVVLCSHQTLLVARLLAPSVSTPPPRTVACGEWAALGGGTALAVQPCEAGVGGGAVNWRLRWGGRLLSVLTAAGPGRGGSRPFDPSLLSSPSLVLAVEGGPYDRGGRGPDPREVLAALAAGAGTAVVAVSDLSGPEVWEALARGREVGAAGLIVAGAGARAAAAVAGGWVGGVETVEGAESLRGVRGALVVVRHSDLSGVRAALGGRAALVRGGADVLSSSGEVRPTLARAGDRGILVSAGSGWLKLAFALHQDHIVPATVPRNVVTGLSASAVLAQRTFGGELLLENSAETTARTERSSRSGRAVDLDELSWRLRAAGVDLVWVEEDAKDASIRRLTFPTLSAGTQVELGPRWTRVKCGSVQDDLLFAPLFNGLL